MSSSCHLPSDILRSLISGAPLIAVGRTARGGSERAVKCGYQMRFLIVHPCDPESIESPVDDWVGNVVHALADANADAPGEQSSFYSADLRKLGYDALELSADAADLEVRIKRYRPDVLLNHAMGLSGAFLREVKRHVRVLAGFHRFPLPENFDFGAYHLMLSPIDNFVDNFRRQGIRCELLRFGFDPAALERLGKPERSVPTSFVGSVAGAHASRRPWLEYVGKHVALQVWAPLLEGLPDDWTSVSRYQGMASGRAKMEVLGKSRITLNKHVEASGIYAGNQCLFDATGAGCLLITDWKPNLFQMFDPGSEVVTYRTPEECVEVTKYYLEHTHERETIAGNGRQRTLRQHTRSNRIEELTDIVRNYL